MSDSNKPTSLADEIMKLADAMAIAGEDCNDFAHHPDHPLKIRAWTARRNMLKRRLQSLESELNDLRNAAWNNRDGGMSSIDLRSGFEAIPCELAWQPAPPREGQYDPDKFRIGDIQRFEFSDLIEQPSGLPCSGPIELGDESGG